MELSCCVMENLILGAFCLILFVCIFTGLPLLGALFLGFLLFFGYGLYRGHSFRAVVEMAWGGVLSVKTIFLVFLLIGMLTAAWRASGTIGYIIALAVRFIRPSVFLLLTFWLNCLVSFLLGTSFGTAATMGVITLSLGETLGIPSLYTGGAMLSGVYFGDRMSPVSTSALLVSVLTVTDIYKNIGNMVRFALVPFGAASLFYLVLGLWLPGTGQVGSMVSGLYDIYNFTPWLVLPAASILVLSCFRVSVKKNMAISIFCALLLSHFVQGWPWKHIVRILLNGYHLSDPEYAYMLSGGGIISMVRVAAIVCLSASFGGIFKGTGLLQGIETLFRKLKEKLGTYPSLILAALFTGMVSCNQTLSIMLTHQLCRPFVPDREQLALDLENTAVVISPLIPWSIACATVLDSTGAPHGSVFLAVYLILLPGWGMIKSRSAA